MNFYECCDLTKKVYLTIAYTCMYLSLSRYLFWDECRIYFTFCSIREFKRFPKMAGFIHQIDTRIGLPNNFRSAFRMPTSRSYPRHLVQFREKEKKKSILPPCNVARVPKAYQGLPRLTKEY